jgi:hypothetical protein
MRTMSSTYRSKKAISVPRQKSKQGGVTLSFNKTEGGDVRSEEAVPGMRGLLQSIERPT